VKVKKEKGFVFSLKKKQKRTLQLSCLKII